MELKEYIRIIKQNKFIFFGVWAAVVVFAMSWFFARPVMFNISIPVEISRSGVEKTQDYQYDYYYRLSADEKYAETVSQWLSDPSVVNEIFSEAGVVDPNQSLRGLSKAFSAEKLSSNYIQIRFKVKSREDGAKVTEALKKVLIGKNEQMDSQTESPNWFSLIFGSPVMVESKTNYSVIVLLSAMCGLILAIFAALVREYWRDEI